MESLVMQEEQSPHRQADIWMAWVDFTTSADYLTFSWRLELTLQPPLITPMFSQNDVSRKEREGHHVGSPPL